MTTMKNSIHDNANGLDYTLVNDHYLPNLTVAAPTEQHPTGRWGRLHKRYALAAQHPEVCQRKARGETGGVTYQVRGAALAIQPVRAS